MILVDVKDSDLGIKSMYLMLLLILMGGLIS